MIEKRKYYIFYDINHVLLSFFPFSDTNRHCLDPSKNSRQASNFDTKFSFLAMQMRPGNSTFSLGGISTVPTEVVQ